MQANLTQEQIDFYRQNGFVVVENFLDQEEVRHWSQAIERAMDAREGRKFPHSEIKTGQDDGINANADYFGKVFDQIINLWMTDEEVKSLILDRRIGKMAAQLAQVDGIRVWHDQALFKRPWANPTSWHLDTPFWSFSHREALSIWIALDDVTIQNGCLFFMPGSNHDTQFDEPKIGMNMGEIFEQYPKYYSREPFAAELKAGSCTFHNGLNIHAAGPNMTTGMRRAMTCAFMPDGATFNGKQNVLPDEYFHSLKVGDVLDNEAQNPLIYHKNMD